MSNPTNALQTAHRAAWIEGISYLALLFVAMPLKYFADLPDAVRVVGAIHGILFVWFIYAAYRAKVEAGWSFVRFAMLCATSLVPFGMILFDRMLVVEEPART
jgi:integral membrane protein